MEKEKNWIPMTKKEMDESGIKQLDYIIITGDAYVDHPSFGVAVIARVLESVGFTVGVISQPNWNSDSDFKKLGKPKYAFLVSAGNIDSMVNHYSVNKNKRKVDIYTPGGKNNKRPNRATIVYCNMIKKVFDDVPIIIGGIEASLRRFSHYDYWSDKVRKSILVDSRADLLVYGMGENTIIEIAEYLKSGLDISDLTFIDGTVYKTKKVDAIYNRLELPKFEEVLKNKKDFLKSYIMQYEIVSTYSDKRLMEQYDNYYVVANPARTPLNENELDNIYNLPFNYEVHPYHQNEGSVEALSEVKFSINVNRGCFASCNFCAITFHQGRIVTSRSVDNVKDEAIKMTKLNNFKGYINDVGGPTANFLESSCKQLQNNSPCKNKKCIGSTVCSNLKPTHNKYLQMLEEVENIPEVKKVFIRSGIRYDYVLEDRDNRFFKKIVSNHVSGQLRLAPEHIDPKTLEAMGKPKVEVYEKFVNKFNIESKRIKKEQYVVPYLMSSHPGCDMNSAIKLAEYLKKINYYPKQVQDFYPTPGTLSTCMYYTGVNPLTNEKVYVEKDPKRKRMQRALMQYNEKRNYQLVYDALVENKRYDLIGNKRDCLIKGGKR